MEKTAQSSVILGLSESEARTRLHAEGYNELPADRGRSVVKIVLEVFREPMFGMLVAAGIIYFILGDRYEAIFLSLFASLSVLITVVQEVRSENVLQALRNLTSPRALVLRDGIQKRIPGREVVRGDLLFLNEGDRVPADGVLIDGVDLMSDESLLTGESIPVTKKPGAVSAVPQKPGGENLPNVFSGTLIVRGYGRAVVTATGPHSQIGQIGQALQSIEVESPHLQKETGRIVRVFGLLCLSLMAIAVVAYGLLRGSWLKAVLGGISLGMALLPEEFPLILTVFMVMGAWRISKARVLTRRATAIEALGSATVLCTDKTGTLTENRMSVAAADAEEGNDKSELVRVAALASKPDTFDPMDAAVFQYAHQNGIDIPSGQLVKQYGLRPELPAVTHIWKLHNDSLYVATKGAPEAIAELCGLNAQARSIVHQRVRTLAENGIRVLGVAAADLDSHAGEFPETPRGYSFRFAGLLGFADPLRQNVQASVAECHAAGIRVIMITGDYPETAKAIAIQAGISTKDAKDNVITGNQLSALDDKELQEKCRSAAVFARILPDQKLRIVTALKSLGEIVAMTGDGVNDAPALKASHIGVAMGGRGTDVAREASSIVILDDEFSSIVRTIRLGRRIYDNLQKAMTYVIAVHVPIAGMAMLPLFLGSPLILTPVLIALMEMVIDPVCSIVLEAETEESNVMSRPPRDPKAMLLPSRLITWGVFQGLIVFLAISVILFLTLRQNLSETQSRSLIFIALMAGNFTLIFVNRSYSTSFIDLLIKRNTFLWGSIIAVAAILSILFGVEKLSLILGLAPIAKDQFLMVVGLAFLLLLFLELVKKIWHSQANGGTPVRAWISIKLGRGS